VVALSSENPQPNFYERNIGKLPFPGRCAVNFVVLSALLYLFLLGLDLMGNAFKGMSGKGVGDMLTSVANPMSGLAIGILGTVLLQSSSTTTSIIVTMVGADILDVEIAIPMIMGANIGTSVTNTIVAHAHIIDHTEFVNGIKGATVHDAFNFLTVLSLMPLEIIGIRIWFPVPIMRNVPLKIAGLLAERTVWFKWFGTYYILTFFILFPLLLFAFSFTIDLGAGGIFLNIVLDLLLISGILVATWKIDKLATVFKLPAKNEQLPMTTQVSEASLDKAGI